MRKEAIIEAKARVITLWSYIKYKKNSAKLSVELKTLYLRKYEYRGGKRVKLTKGRKIKLGNDLIDNFLKKNISIRKDVINQIKLLS